MLTAVLTVPPLLCFLTGGIKVIMAQSYMTVEHSAADEFVERRSRFIGYCRPVSSQEEAVAFINEIRAKHWDASHNVYAYCLRSGQTRRYSDDGEPSGTAGVPVLEVLVKSGVTDLAVVVTRYFGGVLLGAGGLVRAYSHGAKLAVEAAKIITRRSCLLCTALCSYNQYGKVLPLISECCGAVDGSDFTDCVRLDFHIPPEMLQTLNKKLADATCGEVSAGVRGEDFFTFER